MSYCFATLTYSPPLFIIHTLFFKFIFKTKWFCIVFKVNNSTGFNDDCLFVMNIFPLLWSFGLSFYNYRANRQAAPTFEEIVQTIGVFFVVTLPLLVLAAVELLLPPVLMLALARTRR